MSQPQGCVVEECCCLRTRVAAITTSHQPLISVAIFQVKGNLIIESNTYPTKAKMCSPQLHGESGRFTLKGAQATSYTRRVHVEGMHAQVNALFTF